jgi:SAM-dependent methyltransferase
MTPQPSTAQRGRVGPAWLALREAADAAARASDLVEQVRWQLPASSRAVVHDLGCGTGSMGRWLAPRLTSAQHWILYDRDADLLARAAADLPKVSGMSGDGTPVTVETRQRDITRLEPGDLAGASLITASALPDMLTADELERFVTSCADARCPVLLTISVIGRVDLTPADPLDKRFAAAFNAHQRRTTGGRRPLGPDAVGAAVDAFTRRGAAVLVRPSPWRLGAGAGRPGGGVVQWLGERRVRAATLRTAPAGRGGRRPAERHGAPSRSAGPAAMMFSEADEPGTPLRTYVIPEHGTARWRACAASRQRAGRDRRPG